MKIAYNDPANLDIWDQYAIPLATCWRVARTDGIVMWFTDFDMPLQITVLLSGTDDYETGTYSPATGYTRTAIQSNFNLAADNADIDGMLDSSAITDVDLRAGKYQNADVRVYAVQWDLPSPETESAPYVATEVMYLKRGWLGKITLQEHFYKAEWRGMVQVLQSTIGQLWSPTCRATLGDSKCTVPLASLAQINCPVTSVTTYSPPANASMIIGISGKEQVYTYSGGLNIYDNGYVSVTIGGRNYQAPYSEFDTPSTIATTNSNSLTNLINADAEAVVTAVGYGPSVTITSKKPGAQFQYVVSWFTSWNRFVIPNSVPPTPEFQLPSFVANATSNVMGGGADAIADTQEFSVTLALPEQPLNGSGYYDGGLLTWQTGLNAGASMEVKTYSPAGTGSGGSTAIPAWAPSTTYPLHSFVMDSNNNIQMQTVSGGVTGLDTEYIDWATSLGGATAETGAGVTAVWQCLGAIGTWANNKSFPYSCCVNDGNGDLQYQFTPTFTSMASGTPGWNTGVGGQTYDGSPQALHWLNLGKIGGSEYDGAPTAAANTGTGSAWSTPSSAIGSSGTASISIAAGASSQYLSLTGVGLSLPTSAAPAGIVVTINREVTPSTPQPLIYACLTYQGNLIGEPKFLTGAIATPGAQPTLMAGTVATFYPHTHNFAGQFEYTYAGDGYNTPLPSAAATLDFTGNQSIQFNTYPAALLPGLTNTQANNTVPMALLGVTSAGKWDSTAIPIPYNGTGGGAGENYCMVVSGQISIPSAGSYEFVCSHDDGVIIGFGNGATSVTASVHSNPDSGQTKTALHGYPIMLVNNVSGSNAGDRLEVNFPSAGTYSFEIDYCNSQGQQQLVLDVVTTTGTTPIAPPGAGSGSGNPNFVDVPLGGPGDNWGASLTAAIVNDPSFGVALFGSVPSGGSPLAVQANGVSFQVLTNAAGGVASTGIITLYLPMTYQVQVGDTFTIYPGCDKQPLTCANKFFNILNFRGEPAMPGVDTISQVGPGSGPPIVPTTMPQSN